MLDLGDPAHKMFQVSNSATGNYYVSVSDKKLVYSSFTADGYQLKEMSLDKVNPKEVDRFLFKNAGGAYKVANENNFKSMLIEDVQTRSFPVNKYKKGTKLL